MQMCGKASPMPQSTAVAHLCVSIAGPVISFLQRIIIISLSISPGTLEHSIRLIPLPLERLLLLSLFQMMVLLIILHLVQHPWSWMVAVVILTFAMMLHSLLATLAPMIYELMVLALAMLSLL